MGIFWKLKQSRINLLIEIADLAKQYHESKCFAEKRDVYSKIFAIRVLLTTRNEEEVMRADQGCLSPTVASSHFVN